MEVGRQENLFLYNKKKEEKERLCIMCMNVCDLGVYSQPSDYEWAFMIFLVDQQQRLKKIK